MSKIIFGILVIFSVSACGQKTRDFRTFLDELRYPGTTQSAAAELIVSGQSQATVRTAVSNELPAMLLQTKNLDVVRSEAKLAGKLKLESCIPSLITLLNQPNQIEGATNLRSLHEMTNDPIARALLDIGEPAVPALAESLESKDGHTRWRTIKVLQGINSPKSRELLEKHLPRETAPDLRNIIAGGLAAHNS